MPYEITITKTEVREVESSGDWTVVSEELAMPEGVVLSENNVSDLKLKKVYGYTPKIVKSEAVTVEIYRQIVTELDLPRVIAVINAV